MSEQQLSTTENVEYRAAVGDRIIHATDDKRTVFEVLLTKMQDVSAKVIETNDTRYITGSKYRLPLEYSTKGVIHNGGLLHLERQENRPEQVIVKKTKRAGRPRVDGQPSKLEQCRVIFSQNTGEKTRKEIIELFVSQAQCTPAGANTYYLLINKANK